MVIYQHRSFDLPISEIGITYIGKLILALYGMDKLVALKLCLDPFIENL